MRRQAFLILALITILIPSTHPAWATKAKQADPMMAFGFRPAYNGHRGLKGTLQLDGEFTRYGWFGKQKGFYAFNSVDAVRYDSTGRMGQADHSIQPPPLDPSLGKVESGSATGGGQGRGLLVAAGGNQGIQLFNVNARMFIRGGEPGMRTLFTADALRNKGVVRRAARSLGLDLKYLQVDVQDVKLSTPLKAPSDQLTLVFGARLADGQGVVQYAKFSASLRGNPTLGLRRMKLARLEAGAALRGSTAGNWFVPPSLRRQDAW